MSITMTSSQRPVQSDFPISILKLLSDFSRGRCQLKAYLKRQVST
jgi:hypothetical protein